MKDLIVIGAGMAGVNAARKCASSGWDVAIVDALPYGGTCALRGCDPKKMLRRGAEIIDAARLMRGKGIDPNGLRVNWSDLMAQKRSFTDSVPENMEKGLAKAGAKTLHGKVRFVNDTTLEFEDGRRIEARRFFIAAGAKPRPLDVPAAALMADSTDFLELPELPRRILFVGGGYVSFEFAHIAACAGAEVTIIDRGPRPLKAFDPDLVDLLLERSRAIGIDVQLETGLVSIEQAKDGFRVRVKTEGETRELSCDLVVHGAGRVPAIDDLALDAAGIERTISFDRIEVAGRLRDKYFHGSPFCEEDLIEEARPVFYLIEHRPDYIADALLGDCEIALARWANDASPARDGARARENR